MIYTSHSPQETQKIATQFAKKLSPGNWVGLYGDLGAGKTTFVQGMAQGLGIQARYYVNSPTFTLVNDYGPLLHVDLYRLEKGVEVETLGLEEAAEGKIVVIEWAEKFEKRLDFRVRLTHKSGETKERIVEIL